MNLCWLFILYPVVSCLVTPVLPTIPMPLASLSPLLIPTSSVVVKPASMSEQEMSALNYATTSNKQILSSPAVLVQDKDRPERATLAAVVDVRRETPESRFSLSSDKLKLRSCRLLGLARVSVKTLEADGVPLAEGRLLVSDELQPAVGRPSYHSPVSDMHTLNRFSVQLGRAHEKRRSLYTKTLALRSELEERGVDLEEVPPSGEVDYVFSPFQAMLNEAVDRIKRYYGLGYFDDFTGDGEVRRLELGSYVSWRMVASVASTMEIRRGCEGNMGARERYEMAIEVMQRHRWSLEDEISELQSVLQL